VCWNGHRTIFGITPPICRALFGNLLNVCKVACRNENITLSSAIVQFWQYIHALTCNVHDVFTEMHFIDTVNTNQAKFRTKKRYVRAYSSSCAFAKWLRSITRLSHLSVLHSFFFCNNSNNSNINNATGNVVTSTAKLQHTPRCKYSEGNSERFDHHPVQNVSMCSLRPTNQWTSPPIDGFKAITAAIEACRRLLCADLLFLHTYQAHLSTHGTE